MKKCYIRDRGKKEKELLLDERCLLPLHSGKDNNNAFQELSLAVLESDLRSIKNNMEFLNNTSIQKLDRYFDNICLFLNYNPEVFKNFVRRLFKEKV